MELERYCGSGLGGVETRAVRGGDSSGRVQVVVDESPSRVERCRSRGSGGRVSRWKAAASRIRQSRSSASFEVGGAGRVVRWDLVPVGVGDVDEQRSKTYVEQLVRDAIKTKTTRNAPVATTRLGDRWSSAVPSLIFPTASLRFPASKTQPLLVLRRFPSLQRRPTCVYAPERVDRCGGSRPRW